MADNAFYCLLSHEGVLAVRGVDANKFLQGQVTCNLNYLSAERSSLGARCTPKGRMQSSFRALSVENGFLLAMASELIESQLTDLKKYAAFSKSTLSDESAQWLRVGLSGGEQALVALGLDLPANADSVARQQQLIAVRLSDGRAELWLPADQATSTLATLSEHLLEATLNEWLLTQVRAGIGQVFGSTRELFIPQMINLQCLGGVSFKKGCYTGQEIVARMQYLGKLKRRLHRLSAAGEALPSVATQLFSPVHASSVGEVVLAAHSENGIELLAVLQEDAVQNGRVHLSSPDGELLTLQTLPYTPNADEEIKH